MNKSMLTGVVLGSSLAVAGAGIGAYQMFPNEPEFAEVLAVNAVTERVETPREVCKDVTVTRQKAVKGVAPNDRAARTKLGLIPVMTE
mgnify:CR=1 FL=1